MNPIDLAAIALIVVGAWLGFRSGALPQIGGLIGAIGGAALVIALLPALADPIGEIDPNIRPFAVLGGLLIVVALGESVGSTVGRRAATGLGTGVLSAADRVGGAFVGVAQALLIVWLVGGLLAIGPIARLTEAAQTSKAVRALAIILPPPGDFAVELGRLLDSTGLPAVFVGFEPLPQAPVDLPDDPTARRLARAAIESTVKVSAAACGYESTGTGFAVAREYVVTNAHVVAGAGRHVKVRDSAGRLHDALPVLFDPKLDVAVLRVPASAPRHWSSRGTIPPAERSVLRSATRAAATSRSCPRPSPVRTTPRVGTSMATRRSSARSWNCARRSTAATAAARSCSTTARSAGSCSPKRGPTTRSATRCRRRTSRSASTRRSAGRRRPTPGTACADGRASRIHCRSV